MTGCQISDRGLRLMQLLLHPDIGVHPLHTAQHSANYTVKAIICSSRAQSFRINGVQSYPNLR
jgi:hypothetical protein